MYLVIELKLLCKLHITKILINIEVYTKIFTTQNIYNPV